MLAFSFIWKERSAWALTHVKSRRFKRRHAKAVEIREYLTTQSLSKRFYDAFEQCSISHLSALIKALYKKANKSKGSTFKKHDVHCPQGVSTMEGPMQQCYSGKCGSPLTSDRFSRKQRWRISTLCKSKWTPDEKYSTPSAYQIQF